MSNSEEKKGDKSGSDNSSRHFQIYAWTNAVDSLEKLSFFLNQIMEDQFAAKWAVFAAHHALYSFMICSIENCVPSGAHRFTKSGQKLLGDLETSPEALFSTKHSKIVDFEEALKIIQSEKLMSHGYNHNALRICESQIELVLKLHRKFRNNFEHYKPKGWLITFEYFYVTIEATVRVIEGLAYEACTFPFYQDRSLNPRVRVALDSIYEKLSLLMNGRGES